MAEIIWIYIFSLFGIVYFAYGKKNENYVAFFSGILLMAFPYFVSNLYALVGIGVTLIIAPFVIRLD